MRRLMSGRRVRSIGQAGHEPGPAAAGRARLGAQVLTGTDRWPGEAGLPPTTLQMWVSTETIYRALYVQSRGALRRELTRCLRTGRVRTVGGVEYRSRAGGQEQEGCGARGVHPQAVPADRAPPWLVRQFEPSGVDPFRKRTRSWAAWPGSSTSARPVMMSRSGMG
jgi:hypothetical protein